MKEVIGISLGPAAQDFSFETRWLGTPLRVRRLGTDGSAARAARLLRQWDRKASAIGLGLTWLATVPPTAALVGKLFGVRYLGTLFGMTLLSHQIGGFLGAWLGGLAITQLGDYTWMWWADIALAALAALLNLPIREARVVPLAASAAEGR